MLDEIKENMYATMSPTMAIILYETQKFTYYLERRSIKKDGTMGAGVPLTEQCLTSLITTMSQSDKNVVYGTLPPGMLYSDSHVGREKYVWYRKAEKRTLLFNSQLAIPNGEMCIPGLVYCVNGNTLSVYAYKGTLTDKTDLYRAPFFNVSSAHVCLGNARHPFPTDRTYTNIIKYWEAMFWKSEFSHTLGGNPVVGDLIKITTNCIKTGQKFPVKELIPIPNLNVKQLFK